MDRGEIAVRVVVLLAWMSGLLWLNQGLGVDTGFLPLVVVTGLALGAAIDRWWILAVPFAAAAAFSVWAVASQTETQEVAGVFLAIIGFVVAGALCVLLAAGIALRRIWERRRR